MDGDINRDPGIVNAAGEAVSNDTEDGGIGPGGRPERELETETVASPGEVNFELSPGDPWNQGNFGDVEQIVSDNAAVRNAEGGYSGEDLAKGPANTDPEIAQGSF